MTFPLPQHPGLAGNSRLARWSRSADAMTAAEWSVLIGAGIFTAVVSTFVDLHLRIPGHAILKVIFPVAAGMACVPRKGAGTVIGASAFATAVGFRAAGFTGEGLGLGALTSLTAIGPILDGMLRHAQSSRLVYIGFILGGLTTNWLALIVRGSLKGLGWDHGGGRPLSVWGPQALVTYTLCGLIAGLVSASVWFAAGRNAPPAQRESQP